MALQHDRALFNATTAPTLAAEAGYGGLAPLPGSPSKRFAHYADDQTVVIVAGTQEGVHVDLALAHGLAHVADGRRLVLLLPAGHETPTLQRAPWLREDVRPELWVHRDGHLDQVELPSQTATVETVAGWISPTSPAAELAKATTPLHPGDQHGRLDDLVEGPPIIAASTTRTAAANGPGTAPASGSCRSGGPPKVSSSEAASTPPTAPKAPSPSLRADRSAEPRSKASRHTSTKASTPASPARTDTPMSIGSRL